MIRKILLLLVLCSQYALAQQEYHLIKTIPLKDAVSLTTDPLGNAYVASVNTITKVNPTGGIIYSYTTPGFIRLKSIDASNSLRLLLFYPDFAKIEILDSKLALQSTVDTRNIGIQIPLLACTSYNDCIWIYDQQDFKLKRINQHLQLLNESVSLSQTLGYIINPALMLEKNNYLYVNNPSTGILVFDVYGTYYKTIPITGITAFQVIADELLYFKGNTEKDSAQLKNINLKTGLEKNILLPVDVDLPKTLNMRIEGNKLFLLKKEMLVLYTY